MCESCDEWVEEYKRLWPSGKSGRRIARGARSRRPVETWAFLGMVRRMIRAAGKRVADADEVELGALIGLHDELDKAIQAAVDGMRERGMTWAYIGQATGIKRSAAQERWGHA